jgi:hypothetical protein
MSEHHRANSPNRLQRAPQQSVFARSQRPSTDNSSSLRRAVFLGLCRAHAVAPSSAARHLGLGEWRRVGIDRLRGTQRDLLHQAAPRLRPGGTLVYSTCSLEPEENIEAMNKFLGGHPEFRMERSRELLPFADGVDGTFVARMVRKP